MMRPEITPGDFLAGERFVGLCDEAFWVPGRPQNPAVLAAQDGSAIYSHTDQVFALFDVLRTKPGRYVVVTAESDHAVTDKKFAARPWNVVEWFSVNATANHPGCHVLPLGLANESCRVTLKAERIRSLGSEAEKSGWLYVNHRVETNPKVRGPVYEIFRPRLSEGWVTLREPTSAGEMGSYAEELAAHRFICCPPGNGIDTHRMWEALYAGTVPVVLRSRVTEAFADLPLVIVDDYRQVTLPFLQEKYAELGRRTFRWEKLALPYWAGELQAARARVRSTSRLGLIWRWLLRKAGQNT